jgi:hypothetical protein
MEVDIFARTFFQEKFSPAAANFARLRKERGGLRPRPRYSREERRRRAGESGQSRRISWTAPQTPYGKAI